VELKGVEPMAYSVRFHKRRKKSTEDWGNTSPCDTFTDIAIVDVRIPGKHGCNHIPGLPKGN